MRAGYKRTVIARIAAALGFVCGVIGLAAGLTDYTGKFSPSGWFLSGTLLILLAVFVLWDGAIAVQKARLAPRSIDD